MAFTGLQYLGGSTASPSGVDSGASLGAANQVNATRGQLQAFFWLKKAIITARKEQFFSQLASTIGMPKHFGKEIKVFEYVPLLDERNINDQGIDAAGAVIDSGTWVLTFPALTMQVLDAQAANVKARIEVSDINVDITTGDGAAGATYTAVVLDALTGTFTTAQKAFIDALALKYNTAGATSAMGDILERQNSGNLYGSSKDIGTITGKIPTLGEGGGRVNRVGFTRLQRTGSLSKFGFFHEFDKESLDFDTDDELMEHLSTELMNGAVQLTEAVLQKDLLAAAATIIYAGAATGNGTITGETGSVTVVDYSDLMRLSQTLTDNRTPKQTKIITGSRLVDTKTIPAGRVMFIGSELVPVIKGMKDLFEERAFIPVQMYADAGTVLNGEIGTVDEFRIVVVPEMLHWTDGAAHTDGGDGYRVTGAKYNVYPMLVIGDDSFTTIGFQTDGKSAKFSVITKMPGNETADRNDPYGEQGFSSIKWYYGILVKRSERIGMIKTVAPV
jgi:N4-gp56 family major capsid protein